MAFIDVDRVSKSYRVYKRENGIWNNLKSLVHREYVIKDAVKNISFKIERGEAVGYIGMNGAGKSTTIKMLSGILTPSAGKITVGNLVPYEKRKQNARQMGVVFGQRSRLNWDLPMSDTFELYRRIYDIEQTRYNQNLKFYTELLGMKEFINRPIRLLSLGEKMRANLALAFLHDPSVVYLDEPTIGLDVIAKSRIREFIAEINRKNEVTIVLTTHDMLDIQRICRRLIFIHQGVILFDGSIDDFRNIYGSDYKIFVNSSQKLQIEHPLLSLVSHVEDRYVFKGNKAQITPEMAFSFFVNQGKVIASISIEEDSLEDMVISIMGEKG